MTEISVLARQPEGALVAVPEVVVEEGVEAGVAEPFP